MEGVNGKKTKLKERANLFMSMVISSTDIGLMIKQMVGEFTSIKVELNMKDSGRIIFSMVMESKLGKMGRSIKEIMLQEKSMELEATNGKMDQYTLVIGRRINNLG